MIRNRLAKLERLAEAMRANCPGCLLIPPVILMPGDPEPSDDVVRCTRCGKEHRPCGIRFVVPGFGEPLASLD
jgi:hypothetical protein